MGGTGETHGAQTHAAVPAALDAADPRVLVAALAHQLGAHQLVDRVATALTSTGPNSTSGALPPELRDELIDLLGRVTAAPQPTMPRLTDDELARLASFCAGEEVPRDYIPLLREEAGLDGTDLRRPAWDARVVAPARAFRVGIIGAGLGGVCAAIRLAQAGVDFLVLEKNDAVGGTWFENDYPDLRVDVPNHFYSYSFAPNPDWSDHYARRAEIDGYIERCVDDFGIRSRIELDTEVVTARYTPDEPAWIVTVRHGDGTQQQLRFDAIISAVGMLNRPQLPDIAGLDTFAGPWFHSSRWDHSLQLDGRRVGVVGTGASAIQLVPAVAPRVEHLHVFQRARHWVLPNPRYLEPVTPPEQWLFRNVPLYGEWYRFQMFWQNADRLYPAFRVDPEWADQTQSISAANDKLRRRATAYIAHVLDGDDELFEKVVPDYPPFGKRILQDGGWYRTLCRDNVSLVTDGIDHIEPRGVVTAAGELVELDALVLATGFHANKFLWPIEIIGRDGRRLHEIWGDEPRAHLGITVPGFPNLFCIYGPNTNPVVGSVIFMLECQVRYITDCLRSLHEGGWASMECRQDVHDDYNRRVDAEHEQMVWRHPRVHSYYNNAAGHVTTNAPWRLIDYWQMTSAPDLDEFHLVPAG